MRASKVFRVDGLEQSFDIEVSVTGHRDTYGEDRDGNRGRSYVELGNPEYELPEGLGDEERMLVELDLLKQIEDYNDWDWR